MFTKSVSLFRFDRHIILISKEKTSTDLSLSVYVCVGDSLGTRLCRGCIIPYCIVVPRVILLRKFVHMYVSILKCCRVMCTIVIVIAIVHTVTEKVKIKNTY